MLRMKYKFKTNSKFKELNEDVNTNISELTAKYNFSVGDVGGGGQYS